MTLRGAAGHVFYEINISLAALGVALALVVPHYLHVRDEIGIHQCAVAIDSALPGAFCPLSTLPIETDPATRERCCPTPQRHSLDSLCARPGDPPLAAAHPFPSTVRRFGWLAASIVLGILFAGFAGLFLVSLIRERRTSR